MGGSYGALSVHGSDFLGVIQGCDWGEQSYGSVNGENEG